MTRLATYAVPVCALLGAATSVLAQTIATVRVIPSAVYPGKSAFGRVVLTKPAENDMFVTLSGQTPAFRFPTQLPIKKGSTAGGFTITTRLGTWGPTNDPVNYPADGVVAASIQNSTAKARVVRYGPSFVKGTTEIASRNSQNAQAYGASGEPSDLPRGDVRTISADGNLVVFTSLANNLVPNDGNRVSDVFLRDLHSGVTRRISEGTGGVQANARSYHACISSDGKHIAFTSDATNLVPGSPPHSNVYLYRISDGKLSLISGMTANDDSDQPSINADGSVVAFASYASNLTSEPGDVYQDVFVYVRKTGRIELVSRASGSSGTNGHSWHPSINGDGNFVSFTSQSDRFGPLDYNAYADIYLRDRQNRRTELISANDDGSNFLEPTFFSSISEDGNRIAFERTIPYYRQVSVRDRALNRTLIAVSPYNAGSARQNFALSGDGRYIAWGSLQGSDLYSLEQSKWIGFGSDYSPTGIDFSLSRDGRFAQFTSEGTYGYSAYNDYNPAADIYVTECLPPSAMPVLETPHLLLDETVKLKVYLAHPAEETSSAIVRWTGTKIPPSKAVFAPGQTVAELDFTVQGAPLRGDASAFADYASSSEQTPALIHKFLFATEFPRYPTGTKKLNATIRVGKPVTVPTHFSVGSEYWVVPLTATIPTGSKSVTFEITLKANPPGGPVSISALDAQRIKERANFYSG